MNAISLIIGGVTKSLNDWGFTNARLSLRSRAPSSLALDTAGADPSAAPTIAYGASLTMNVAMGDGTTYTFVGRRRKFNAHAHPESWSTSMIFEDVWSNLLLTTFQHYWAMSDGAGHTTNKYFSSLNLFQDIHGGPGVAWVYLNADDQLREIVEFAQTICGLPVQCGDTDPVINMPVCAVKAISCAEALQMVMKPLPDMVTKMDYSTTPATVHFKQRRNCVPITLPFAGTDTHGRHHKSSDLTPRPDLQVPAVVTQYQITGTIDGVAYNDSSVDAYPPGATGLAENALVFPIDLRGPSRTDVKGTLVTEAIDPTTTAFWKEHKPDLDDTNITSLAIVDTTINGGGGHPDGITILDSDGAAVTLADYPNKLLSGQPAQWMLVDGSPVEAFEVTIRATLKYVKNIPTSTPMTVHSADKHVVEVRLRLTDAPTGSTTYNVAGSSDSGDPLLTGLAYFMWCSINNVDVNYVGGIATPPAEVPAITAPDNLQWEGEHEIVENTIYSIVTPANLLNLSGGNPDWASMNAVIYGVEIDFFYGRTSISIGPFKHLQAAAYFEMVMAFRYRMVFTNPNLRNTGAAGGEGSTDLGGDSPKENTTHGIPQQDLHTTLAPDSGDATKTVMIQHDAANNGGQIIAQTIDSTGANDDTKPLVQLSQDDLGTIDDAGLIGREANWRKYVVLDPTSGDPVQIVVAASDSESTSVDVGGGSSASKAVINTVSGNPDIYANYFIVNTGSVSTTASFSGSVTTITVTSATGIKVGQVVSGTHIAAQTTVTSVSGTTIGISNATTGTSSGSYTFIGLLRVAKNYKLRNAISSEVIDTTTWSYTYGGSSPYTYVTRKATAGSNTEYQVIVPRYLAGDEIWYEPVANTDIGSLTSSADTISATGGAAIVLLDTNRDGRTWSARASQAGYENT